MRKNGFTLIELLAVIVILAIIALIATPIILGIINDAREESQERSAELYLSAVDLAVARRNLTEEFNPKECTIAEGVVTCEGYEEPLYVDVDGEVPISGTIKFESNKVTTGTTLTFKGFTANINDEKKLVVVGKDEEKQPENDKLEIVCKAVTLAEEGKYTYGDEYLCDPGDGINRTFYLLEDGDNTTLTKMNEMYYITENDNVGTSGKGEITLLMKENLVENVNWCKSELDNTCLADGAFEQLENNTIEWTVDTFLPTYSQLYNAGFKGYGNTDLNWQQKLSGYAWTITANANNTEYVYFLWAWDLMQSGPEVYYENPSTGGIGIKPVITISKSQIE